MKLPYSEGTVFLVPLKDGGFARGVVARSGPKGKILFGYFFGPRLASTDNVQLDDLRPSGAILRLMFGDAGLRTKEWPIVGAVREWDRSEWPMPDFVRRAPGIRPFLVRYCDTDPTLVEADYPIHDDAGMPTDSLSGDVAVGIKLAMVLRAEAGEESQTHPEGLGATSNGSSVRRSGVERSVDYYLYFPTMDAGKRVASILREKGFSVKDELGADDVKWLVLVTTSVAKMDPGTEEADAFFNQVAHEYGGEYDGWEADV
jgi:hypothetical protein